MDNLFDILWWIPVVIRMQLLEYHNISRPVWAFNLQRRSEQYYLGIASIIWVVSLRCFDVYFDQVSCYLEITKQFLFSCSEAISKSSSKVSFVVKLMYLFHKRLFCGIPWVLLRGNGSLFVFVNCEDCIISYLALLYGYWTHSAS